MNKYRVVIKSIVDAWPGFLNKELIIEANSMSDAVMLAKAYIHDSTVDIFVVELIGYGKEFKVASKKQSRKQARIKRRKAKIKRAKKKAKIKTLLFKQFNEPKPEPETTIQFFNCDDDFEYIVADEKAEYQKQRDILFRNYAKS